MSKINLTITELTSEVKNILSAGAVSPRAFVDTFTRIESLILDLRLTRNSIAAKVAAESVVQYKRLRYDSDEVAGHQEATRLLKGQDSLTSMELQIADTEAYISHLKSLIDLMTMFEKMTRY